MISIIIPAHNEEKRISKTLQAYAKFLNRKFGKNYKIIVILNGCTDNTLDIVKKMAKKYKTIKYRNYKKAGKGFAIIQGFKIARGSLVGYVDADLATSPEAFYNLVENIKEYDGIIASRYIKGAIVKPKQSLSRIIASRIFNFLVRSFFFLPYHDTQLGAKIFKKQAIKKIMPFLGITEWAFDVDLLYHLKKNGFKIKEHATIWHDIGGSKLNLKKTSIEMFLSILRLRIVRSPFGRTAKLLKPILKIADKIVRE